MILYCDLETFSSTPIKFGPHKYAEAKDARILLWGYAINDEPAKVWQVGREPVPQDLLAAVREIQRNPDPKVNRHVWHNGINFDTVFIERNMPDMAMPLACIDDTMLIAYEHGLPGGLGDLSNIYGLAEDKAKDKDGRRLIGLFCSPRFDGPITPENHPEDWEKFVNYCRLDIEAEREIYKKMPRFNYDRDRDLIVLDAQINRRGMLMDVELATKAVDLLEENSRAAKNVTVALTGGELDSTTRTAATIAYIEKEFGFKLGNLRKGEVEALIQRDDIPDPMRELLRIRLCEAKASVKKFTSLLDCVNADGRLRGCLQLRGAARTGRYSGRLFQPQNLPRPTLSDEAIEDAIDAVKGGYLDCLYDSPATVAPSLLRGTIIVPKGKRMVVADYSNIEGRVLAWLAGERWKIKAFEEYDSGVGPDLYKLTYSKAFSVPVEKVTKAQRQMGKVLELAMGYGGGVGAFVTFARGYGIDLHDMARATLPTIPNWARMKAESARLWAEQNKRTLDLDHDVWVCCESVKLLWRKANSKIVDFWGRIEDACGQAIATKVGSTEVFPNTKIQVAYSGRWLFLRLPSGRALCYPHARACTDSGGFVFKGVHQLTRKWTDIPTFGGRITENIVQAIAADLLTNALFSVADEGFGPILSVHDEILTEAPDDEEHDHAALEKAMTKAPSWAHGLPLAAAGFESYRYHK